MLFCGFKIKAETLTKIKQKAKLQNMSISEIIRDSLEKEFDCLDLKENMTENGKNLFG